MFDAGTTSYESWLIAASKLAWKIATSSTLLPVRLWNHTNKARAKNSETNSKTTGADMSCSTPQPALWGSRAIQTR